MLLDNRKGGTNRSAEINNVIPKRESGPVVVDIPAVCGVPKPYLPCSVVRFKKYTERLPYIPR